MDVMVVNVMFSQNLHFIFLGSDCEIYLILCFVAFFSEFV